MNTRRALSTAAIALVTTFAGSASADLLPEGKTYVPMLLTLEGQDAFKDTTFVILGCNSKEGRHTVAFATAAQMECRVKHAPVVYAIPTKEKKPLEDLVAKDLGWGAEGGEARKLLEKKTSCGTIEESTLVDRTANIASVVAKFQIEKGEGGKCSLKKVSVAQVNAKNEPVGATAASGSAAASAAASGAASASGSAASSASASASASSKPAPSASAAPAKSGCSASNLGSAGGSGLGLALAIGLGVAIARRRRA